MYIKVLSAVILLAEALSSSGAVSAATTVYISTYQGIFKVDTATGDRTLISGWGPDGEDLLGSGLSSYHPWSLELVPGREVAYGMTPKALLRIDLETGDRTVVSAAKEIRDSYPSDKPFGPRGDGPTDEDFRPFAKDFALDLANERAIVQDELGGVWTIDLDSGDRRRLWEKKIREVVEIASNARIEALPEPGRVLLFRESIWSMDVDSGEATLHHDGDTRNASDDSLNWISCRDFAFDPEQNRAALLCSGIVMPVSLHDLPWDISNNFVLEVNPLNSERAVIAGPDRGEGLAFWDDNVADFKSSSHLAWDGDGERILIMPEMARCADSPLVAVDPATGDREILSFKGQCNDQAPDIPVRRSGPALKSGAIAVVPAK